MVEDSAEEVPQRVEVRLSRQQRGGRARAVGARLPPCLVPRPLGSTLRPGVDHRRSPAVGAFGCVPPRRRAHKDRGSVAADVGGVARLLLVGRAGHRNVAPALPEPLGGVVAGEVSVLGRLDDRDLLPGQLLAGRLRLDRCRPVRADTVDRLPDRPAPLFAPGQRGVNVLGIRGYLRQQQRFGVREPVIGEHHMDRARKREHGDTTVDLGAGTPHRSRNRVRVDVERQQVLVRGTLFDLCEIDTRRVFADLRERPLERAEGPHQGGNLGQSCELGCGESARTRDEAVRAVAIVLDEYGA